MYAYLCFYTHVQLIVDVYICAYIFCFWFGFLYLCTINISIIDVCLIICVCRHILFNKYTWQYTRVHIYTCKHIKTHTHTHVHRQKEPHPDKECVLSLKKNCFFILKKTGLVTVVSRTELHACWDAGIATHIHTHTHTHRHTVISAVGSAVGTHTLTHIPPRTHTRTHAHISTRWYVEFAHFHPSKVVSCGGGEGRGVVYTAECVYLCVCEWVCVCVCEWVCVCVCEWVCVSV